MLLLLTDIDALYLQFFSYSSTYLTYIFIEEEKKNDTNFITSSLFLIEFSKLSFMNQFFFLDNLSYLHVAFLSKTFYF